jgi:hypothetical protein
VLLLSIKGALCVGVEVFCLERVPPESGPCGIVD